MKAVIAFIDALGWHYFEDGLRFLEGELRAIGPVQSGMGFSSSIIPTIWSGESPDQTGIWTEYRLVRPADGPVIDPRFVPAGAVVNAARLVAFRVTRKLGMAAMHQLRLPLEYTHLLRRNPITYSQFPPASMPVSTLADDLATRGIRPQFQFHEARMDVAAALSRVKSEKPQVVIFHLAGLDWETHKHGPRMDVVVPQMKVFESLLSETRELMSDGSGEVVLAVFSDHGMARVERTHDLITQLRPLTMGRDFVTFMDTTLARFWVDTPSQAARLKQALGELPWGSLLTDDDRGRYGLRFADDSYGQLVFVASEGNVIYPNFISPTLFRGAKFVDQGVHGYRPESPSATAVFGYSSSRAVPLPTTVREVRGALNQLLWGS